MYSVNDYLDRLRLARRSGKTIALYGHTLRSFAGFLGVDAEDLHNHLDPDNLIMHPFPPLSSSISLCSIDLSYLRNVSANTSGHDWFCRDRKDRVQ